jgi:hypothetical protein
MPGGQYIALSGMRTRLDELDRLAADIANVATAGYKSERGSNLTADRPVFNDVLQSAIDVTGGGRRLDSRAGAIVEPATPTSRSTATASSRCRPRPVPEDAQRPSQPQRGQFHHAGRLEGDGRDGSPQLRPASCGSRKTAR